MQYEIPRSSFVYEFSYPEEMPELAGIVFYVGKGTNTSRMDMHFYEAANGCDCAKCNAIHSVWDAGLVVIRRIVFESRSESVTLNEERRRILQHRSPYLTNIVRTKSPAPEKTSVVPEVLPKKVSERWVHPALIVNGKIQNRGFTKRLLGYKGPVSLVSYPY